MGSNSSSLSQTSLNCSSLLKRYQIIDKNQEKSLTIVKEKQFQSFFIIKEIIFVQKSIYERHLCRFNHFQEMEQSENTLNLYKVWTQQHNTLCSNTYKIFAMYEFSNVTLLDQIEARRAQLKHFQEDELLGVIQSCVNAMNCQSPMLISPNQYYIAQDGLLKINNVNLFDNNVLETYTKGVYYSPQKMENFNNCSLYTHNETYLKEVIFSLGMTLLSAIYLEELTDKIYNPLLSNKKMRFNSTNLDNLIQRINFRNVQPLSDRLLIIISKMVDYNPKNRPSLTQIQDELEQISKLKTSQIQIDQQNIEQFDPQLRMAHIELSQQCLKQNKVPVFKAQNLSTIYDKNIQNPSNLGINTINQNSELQILKQLSRGNYQSINKVDYEYQQNKHQVQIPLTLSKSVNKMMESRKSYEVNMNLTDFPSPISSQNPLFTNPQFMARINQDIKRFNFERKNSFSSTQISRQNSQFLLGERHQNHQKILS